MSADPGSPRIWIAEGGEAGRPVALPEGRTVFGRADSCEVTLDDEAVSTDHLEISVRGGSLLATYGGQALGYYAAGERAGFIAATLGAIAILFVYGMVRKGGNAKPPAS